MPQPQPQPQPVPTPDCTATATATKQKKTLYFNAVGPYPRPGRTTPTLQQGLQAINYIAGINGVSSHLDSAQRQVNQSSEPWFDNLLMGRKYEAERAIFFAGRNALASVNSTMPEIDFIVRNFGTINYVQVKWSDKGLSQSEASEVMSNFQNNPMYPSGSFLLETTTFSPAAVADLINKG